MPSKSFTVACRRVLSALLMPAAEPFEIAGRLNAVPGGFNAAESETEGVTVWPATVPS